MSISIVRGQTYTETVTSLGADGLPEDLTGALIEVEVKRFIDDPDPALIHLSVGAGVVILNQVANKGKFTFTIAPADTSAFRVADPTRFVMEPGKYTHDIWRTLGTDRKPVRPPTDLILAGAVNFV